MISTRYIQKVIDKEKIMFEINVSQLCGSDDEYKKPMVSGSLSNAKQDLIDAIEKSKSKSYQGIPHNPFKPDTFI
jgi:hypothetical protein